MPELGSEDSRKAFHFDLSEERLKCFYPGDTPNAYKRAWGEIRTFMEERGFEHTQYSGYESLNVLTDYEAYNVILRLQEKFPWFMQCAQVATLTDIGETHDVLMLLKEDYQSEKGTHEQRPRATLREEGQDMGAASKRLGQEKDSGHTPPEQSLGR